MQPMFSHIDRVLDGALSASSEAATLPATNLADKRIGKVWRSLVTTASFDVDFLSAYSIRALGIFGATLSSTDTVRHRLSAVSVGAGELLDTGAIACGVIADYNQHLHILAAAVTARYWRCDIVATSRAAEGYFDVGRAWAGSVWAPERGFTLGWQDGWRDTSRVTRAMRSGAVFTDVGVMYREMRVSFDMLSEADRTAAKALDAYAGRNGQILFIPDADSANINIEAILGRMKDTSPISQPSDAFPAVYSKSYDIEQDL